MGKREGLMCEFVLYLNVLNLLHSMDYTTTSFQDYEYGGSRMTKWTILYQTISNSRRLFYMSTCMHDWMGGNFEKLE